MKLLTKIICSCEDCTHFAYDEHWGCCNGEGHRAIHPEDDIPVWCPLPDFEIEK